MSILIKNMKMPDHCIRCPFMVSRDDDDCILQSEEENSAFEYWDQMRENCPLIEVKTPHGRLFDETEVKKCLQELSDSDDKWSAIALLEWAIEKRICIEAEEKE